MRVLVIREDLTALGKDPDEPYHWAFVEWLERHAPDVELTFRAPLSDCADAGAFDLVALWLQDPLRELRPRIYRWAWSLPARAFFNGPDALSGTSKSRQLRLWREADLPAPAARTFLTGRALRDADLSYPCLVRSDIGHSGKRGTHIHLCRAAADRPRRVMLPAVAIEFVDLREPDGLVRKRRAVVAGNRAIPRHELAASDPVVHLSNCVANERELDYTDHPEPHETMLVQAARALGVDAAAIDYGLRADGSPVLFEANPFYMLLARSTLTKRGRGHLVAAVERCHEALLQAWRAKAAGAAMEGQPPGAPRLLVCLKPKVTDAAVRALRNGVDGVLCRREGPLVELARGMEREGHVLREEGLWRSQMRKSRGRFVTAGLGERLRELAPRSIVTVDAASRKAVRAAGFEPETEV